MNLELSTPALIFPAITLLILAYTHRFAQLNGMIRDFAKQKEIGSTDLIEAQLRSFRQRVHLVQATEAFGLLGLILSLLSTIAVFLEKTEAGIILFVGSLALVLLSLTFALWEVLVSTRELHMLLEQKNTKSNKLINLFKKNK